MQLNREEIMVVKYALEYIKREHHGLEDCEQELLTRIEAYDIEEDL